MKHLDKILAIAIWCVSSFITAPDALNRQIQAEIKAEIMRD